VVNLTFYELNNSQDTRRLWDALLSKCGIPYLDRILVEQNQAMIAADSALGLLSFIERSIGSDALRIQMEECNKSQTSALQSILAIQKEQDLLSIEQRRSEPELRLCEDLYRQRKQLDERWIGLHKWQRIACATAVQSECEELLREENAHLALEEEIRELESEQISLNSSDKTAAKSFHAARAALERGGKNVEVLEGRDQAGREALHDLQIELKKTKRQQSNHQAQVGIVYTHHNCLILINLEGLVMYLNYFVLVAEAL
jgi:hypothetical protein